MRGDVRPPRSLFIRPLSHVKKKEFKKSLQKKQSNVLLHQRDFPILPTLSSQIFQFIFMTIENCFYFLSFLDDKENNGDKVDQSDARTFEIKATKNPDWLVNEDWKLLHVC